MPVAVLHGHRPPKFLYKTVNGKQPAAMAALRGTIRIQAHIDCAGLDMPG